MGRYRPNCADTGRLMLAAVKKHGISTLIVLLTGLIGCFVGVNFVLQQRQQARNTQCGGRMAQLGFALQGYYNKFGRFPHLAERDADGRPLMSWRVQLLPYLDTGDVYGRLDLSQPWDSPKNVIVAEQSLPNVASRFRSPNDFKSADDNTSFVAVSLSPEKSPDGRNYGRGIIIVEIHNTGIHWMEPRDLTLAQVRSRVVEMVARGKSVHVLTADGQVGYITEGSLVFHGSVDDLLTQWLQQD